MNKLNKCTLTIENNNFQGKKIDFDTKLYRKTETNIQNINGTPFITLNVFPEICILNSEENFDYTNKSNLRNITDYSNIYFKNLIKEYLYIISKEYMADIADFQGIYKSTFFTEEDFNKINWEKNFQNSFFEVNVFSRINSSNLYNKE